MSQSLSHARERYEVYNREAQSHQGLYRGGRLVVLLLGLGAAIAGAIRISLSVANPALNGAVTVLPLLATGLGFLIWALGFARHWVAFRAGAEAVKAEAFLYATSAEKYATEDRDALLNRRVAEIARNVERIRHGEDDKVVESYRQPSSDYWQKPTTSFPDGSLGAADYLRLRVEDQLSYYIRRAGEHGRIAIFFLILTLAASTGTSVLGYLHIDAWVPVLTTLSGSLSAYATVRADDFLAASYRATARQLAELASAWRNHEYGSDLSAFAAQVEQILIREHGGWMALIRHLGGGEVVPKK